MAKYVKTEEGYVLASELENVGIATDEDGNPIGPNNEILATQDYVENYVNEAILNGEW